MYALNPSGGNRAQTAEASLRRSASVAQRLSSGCERARARERYHHCVQLVASFPGAKVPTFSQSEKCDLHSEFLNHVLVRPKQTACDILILQTILALVALCGIVYVFFCAIG